VGIRRYALGPVVEVIGNTDLPMADYTKTIRLPKYVAVISNRARMHASALTDLEKPISLEVNDFKH
jgi:hypothetical protein